MSNKRNANKKLWQKSRRGKVNQNARSSAIYRGRSWIFTLVARAIQKADRINKEWKQLRIARDRMAKLKRAGKLGKQR